MSRADRDGRATARTEAPEAGRGKEGSFPGDFRASPHLDCGCLASVGTVRELLSIVLSPQGGFFHGSPRTHAPLLPKHTTQRLRPEPTDPTAWPCRGILLWEVLLLAVPDWAMPCPLLSHYPPRLPRQQGPLALTWGSTWHSHACTEGHACTAYAGCSQK